MKREKQMASPKNRESANHREIVCEKCNHTPGREVHMITQETAARIYSAYREIEAGKKLLAEMGKRT
jgi:hypothetical protein